MASDAEGQKQIAIELYERFHAMKTYGKEPESLESITRIFKKDLACFPAEKILKAIATHATRSDEFPTVADIAGIIKRNGKPPIKESDIISIRKMDGHDRTSSDWEMLRDWDYQQREESWDYEPPEKQEATVEENLRLRADAKKMRAEIDRLTQLLRNEQLKNRDPLTKPKITAEERMQRTVADMRERGVSEEEINDFIFEATTAPNTVYAKQDAEPLNEILNRVMVA